MSLQENLDYLYSLTRFGIKTGLGNIRKLCSALNNPQDKYPVIHIAGTNGKGTTASMTASILRESGLKVGLYTSPHLVHFGERIRVNDDLLTDEEASMMIEELRTLFDKINSSFFESTTAMAFLHFLNKKVDVAVIETGLGGNLDSTNIVRSLMSIFTPISFDHTDRLGNELCKIAEDKSGIIKPFSIAVSSVQHEEALDKLKTRAKSQNSDFYYAPDFVKISGEVKVKYDETEIPIEHQLQPSLSGTYKIALPGRHHVDNLQTVLTAATCLKKEGFNLPGEIVKSGIEKVRWKARLEILKTKPLIYYDVAHNPAAAKVTADFFAEVFPNKKIKILMGIMVDKDIISVLKEFARISDDFIFVDLNDPRGMPPDDLCAIARKMELKAENAGSASNGIQRLLDKCSDDDVVLITGSHYLGQSVYKNI